MRISDWSSDVCSSDLRRARPAERRWRSVSAAGSLRRIEAVRGSPSMLKLWGRTTSSNVMKVLWTSAELGLPFERVDVGGPYGGNLTPDYLAITANGLVPTSDRAHRKTGLQAKKSDDRKHP